MKARPFFVVLAVAFVVWLIVAVRAGVGDPTTSSTSSDPDPPPVPSTTTVEVDRRVQGKTARQWHRVALRYLTSRRNLKRALRFDPEVSTAIGLACTIYRVSCATLWRKADCETGGTFSRYSANRSSSARGLFQFLTTPNGGTWATTPFGRFSVYDPYVNAAAAAWMHRVGRGGEWSCR